MASSIYTSRPQRTHCAAAVHRSLPDLSLASFLRSSKTPDSLRTSSVNLIIQTAFKKAASALWQPLRLGYGRASTSSVVSCGPQATSLSKMDLVHGLFCWVVCGDYSRPSTLHFRDGFYCYEDTRWFWPRQDRDGLAYGSDLRVMDCIARCWKDRLKKTQYHSVQGVQGFPGGLKTAERVSGGIRRIQALDHFPFNPLNLELLNRLDRGSLL